MQKMTSKNGDQMVANVNKQLTFEEFLNLETQETQEDGTILRVITLPNGSRHEFKLDPYFRDCPLSSVINDLQEPGVEYCTRALYEQVIEIPAKVVSIRNGLGYTQEQLAAKLKINVRTLQRWESGKNEPSASHFRLLERMAN